MKKLGTVITLAIVVMLAFVAFVLYGNFNSIQKEMVSKENSLNAQYQDNQNELSTYIVTIKESMGVANKNTEALDEVLSNAIKGRYESDNASTDGQLFSAMVEAYPELGNVSTSYEQIQNSIVGGREAYKNKQTKLLDMLRDYDTWRNSGLVRSQMVKFIGAPSENLVARIGTDQWTGKDALNKMYQIVLVEDAKESYSTGELQPLEFE